MVNDSRNPFNCFGLLEGPVTAYPPGPDKVFEREAPGGNRIVFDSKVEEMIATVAVGKWEYRGVGRIPKQAVSRKPWGAASTYAT
jgi:hypothetical protein